VAKSTKPEEQSSMYVYESHIDEKSADTDGENSAHQWPTHGKG
jgi:hypothetical protein